MNKYIEIILILLAFCVIMIGTYFGSLTNELIYFCMILCGAIIFILLFIKEYKKRNINLSGESK